MRAAYSPKMFRRGGRSPLALVALASQDTSFTVWHEALQRPLFIGTKLFKCAA